MLQGLPYVPSAIRGSYIRLEYAVSTQLESFIRVVNDDNQLITSLLSQPFLVFPASDISPRAYDISTTQTAQGTTYNLTVSGLLKNLDSAALEELRRMKNLDFAIKLTTIEGTTFLAAEPNYPAEFDFSIKGGDFGAQKGKVEFKFKSKSPNIMCKI